jgi:hypothetical protein
MTATPISILQKAADLGLRLGLKSPNTLTVESAEPWPSKFADTLRDYKTRLIALLRLPFVMMYSEILKETIFFCGDEATKAALVESGASKWSIYTKDELRVLVTQHRAKAFLPDELCKLHEAKRRFNGTVTP